MEELAFSARVKDELAHLMPEEECCRRMELAALLRACGRIALGGPDRLSVTLRNDRAPVARKILRLIRAVFGLKTQTMVMRQQKLRKNLTYFVRIPPQRGLVEMLQATGILDEDGSFQDWVEVEELQNDHCRRAYLRGTFLGNGWISPPERQHHLEMSTTSTEAADSLGQFLFRYSIPIRLIYRKETHVLYLKDASHIARFLTVVGAHQSLLHYEDVRAMKEMKNLVNRQVNAETANLTKTVEAAGRQIELLEQFRASGGLDRAPESLREIALLRLRHPDASLKELGELCFPKLSKSAVNHRMRQLMQLASPSE